MSVGILATLCTIALAAGSVAFRAELPALPTPRAIAADTSVMLNAAPEADQPDADARELVDSYGNTVSRAIASYKLDPTGALYEEHSPQTEIPRLGIPKS